jgi:aspartyl aminopeptidase
MSPEHAPSAPNTDELRALLSFIDASPSPYHAVDAVVARLAEAGFRPLDATAPFAPGRHMLISGGALLAWDDTDVAPHTPFRIVGAHTDSPNLRIKPQPDHVSAGYEQLGVELYGGVLRNSWLDRDLGLSGRVMVRTPDGPVTRLFLAHRPLLRVPQLAIHLDRKINDSGLLLNAQTHMAPIWGLAATDSPARDTDTNSDTDSGSDAAPSTGAFARFLGDELDVDPAEILSWEIMAHDLTPGSAFGRNDEFYAAPRIDNLASVHAATGALVAAVDQPTLQCVPMVAFFDHEEVGSTSASGAGSPALATVLERSVLARGGDREVLHQARAASHVISADGAHATHPNYADRHEPNHGIALNGGPVLKANANQRYATDALTAAPVLEAAEVAGVPMQHFVTRTDLACGSTIGPITAAAAGLAVADVGAPQLSMHSAREMAGSSDPGHLLALLTAYLSA